MKAVINGKLYNTETAEQIHNYHNGYPISDFHYCEEALYRTKKGAFFLAGEGGALSKWSRASGGNGRCGGDGIEVLTPDEALEWLEGHGADPETIEEAFPGKIEEA